MIALLRRELHLAARVGGGAWTGLLFSLAVVIVTPFALGPDPVLLARIGPAILWIGALLAGLLGLDRLFQPEREDGSLDLLLMGETPASLVVAVKCLAHWLVTGLPLVLATPLYGLMLNLSPQAMAAVTVTLLVGTPALSFLGAVGAAAAVSLPRGGLLVAVLTLPLAVPVLIFGVSATQGALAGQGGGPDLFLAPFLMECALTLFLAVLGPLAAGLALRAGPH